MNYYMDVMFITIILSQKEKECASAVSDNPKLTEDQKKKWLSVITLDFNQSLRPSLCPLSFLIILVTYQG